MGAEMTLAWIKIPAVGNGIFDSIAALDTYNARKRVDNDVPLTNEFFHADALDEVVEVKDAYRQALIEIRNLIDRRDIAYFYHKGDWIILSGGMSYGDDPTDVMSTLDILDDLMPYLLKEKDG